MSVSIIISEQQKRNLLIETISDEIKYIVKKNTNLIKKVLKESQKQIGVDLSFLLSWGSTIGGFMSPINDYIRDNNPTLNDTDVALILTGIISTYYIDNKDLVKKIMGKVKESNLISQYKKALNKSDELYSTFIDFIKSLNMTSHKITNIISYTFIIPLLPLIYGMTEQSQLTQKDINEIVTRLTSFTLLTVSGVLMKELISKIIQRFESESFR